MYLGALGGAVLSIRNEYKVATGDAHLVKIQVPYLAWFSKAGEGVGLLWALVAGRRGMIGFSHTHTHRGSGFEG